MTYQQLIGALMLFIFATFLLLLFREIRHRRHVARRVKKLYKSTLFNDIRPFFHMCREVYIEKLLVDKNGITLSYWKRGKLKPYCLKMSDLGRPNLSNGQQEALCKVLENEVEVFTHRQKYKKTVRYLQLPNGNYDHTCRYAIRTAYKQQLSSLNGSDIGV